MFGFQEIMVVSAVILGVIFLPRMTTPRTARRSTPMYIHISGRMRIALAASAIFPILAAAYFEPWHNDPVPFCYFGLGPVALGWLFYWVFRGFKRH